MVFNDTSTRQGLIQSCEFWAGLNDEDISGDTALLKLFTNRINRRLERYLGQMGAGSRIAQLDDVNYTEQPFSTFDLLSGQHDYEFLEDDDGNAITDITAVLVQSENSTDFVLLDRMSVDDKDAHLVMSPNPSASGGTPNRFLEVNNTVFLDPKPNYSASASGKTFYKRAPSYFTTADTTKEPGILPANFHEMIAIASSYDYLLVFQSNAKTLISRVEIELNKMEGLFDTFTRMRNPQKPRLIPRYENNR